MTIKRIIFSPHRKFFIRKIRIPFSLEADSFKKKKKKRSSQKQSIIKHDSYCSFFHSYMSMIVRSLSLEQVQSVIN